MTKAASQHTDDNIHRLKASLRQKESYWRHIRLTAAALSADGCGIAHSCVQCRHSCRRPLPAARRGVDTSLDTARMSACATSASAKSLDDGVVGEKILSLLALNGQLDLLY